jgi:hypothetical protein
LALHFEVGNQKKAAKPLQNLIVPKKNAPNCRRPVKPRLFIRSFIGISQSSSGLRATFKAKLGNALAFDENAAALWPCSYTPLSFGS